MAKLDTTKTDAVEETATARTFVYNGAEMEDPDPNMKDEDVKTYYSQVYPEVTTANLSISFEDRDGVRTKIVTFKKAAGTKG